MAGILILLIDWLFTAFYILMFARILLSFVQVSPYHPTWGGIVRLVYQVTEPIMAPFRGILPPIGGLDFSPILLFLLAGFLESILQRLVIQVF